MPDNQYATDVSDAAWALLAPLLPAALPGGRPRTTDLRAVINDFLSTAHGLPMGGFFRASFLPGARCITIFGCGRTPECGLACNEQSMTKLAERSADLHVPSVVIMDGQSVKTTERGGVRGFDAHKRVKGRKRHILVDTLGLPIACRVEAANISDRRAADLLLGGLRPLFPDIRTVIADAGHESSKLAHRLLRDDVWKLQIVTRGQRAFQITGLTWIVSAPLHGSARKSPPQQRLRIIWSRSETLIDIATIRIYAQPTRPSVKTSQTPSEASQQPFAYFSYQLPHCILLLLFDSHSVDAADMLARNDKFRAVRLWVGIRKGKGMFVAIQNRAGVQWAKRHPAIRAKAIEKGIDQVL